MNDEMRVAYIKAQVIAAEARLYAMQAANMQARKNGDNLPYGFCDFDAVPQEFGLCHNQVISYLAGGR